MGQNPHVTAERIRKAIPKKVATLSSRTLKGMAKKKMIPKAARYMATVVLYIFILLE